MFDIHRSSASALANGVARTCLICLCLVAGATPGLAYRPFDGTDAAVADEGKLEIELQPAGRLRDSSGTTLVAPAARFNFGLTATGVTGGVNPRTDGEGSSVARIRWHNSIPSSPGIIQSTIASAGG